MGKDEVLPLECITELLKVEQVIGESVAQTSVIREITLPGRIRKITEVDATLRDIKSKVIENKVIVEGVIHKQIFFVDDDTGQLKEHTVPDEKFVHFVDVPGAFPSANVQVHARIEFVGHDFLFERRHENAIISHFRQTVVVEIFAKVTESIQLDVVIDVKGIDPKRVTRELLKVESVVGENASQASIIRDVVLPRPARKIKNIDATVEHVVSTVIENKVVVEGVLHKQIFFVGDSDVVYEVSVDERFSHFVDVPGAFPGANVQVYPRVEFVDIVIDPYDRTRGRQTAIVDLFVKVTETVQVDVVTDIKDVKVKKELLKVAQVVGEGVKQHSIVANLTAPFPARKIAGRPLTKFEHVTTKVIENKVIVEGELVKQIFFVREGEVPDVREFEVRERFTVFIDIPGAKPGHVAQVSTRVEFVDFEIDPYDRRRIRQTTVIEVFVKVTEFVQLEIVIECPVKPVPILTVYIVQPSDTLFKISRRFSVTIQEILKANPDIKDPNLIFPGQKILIPAPPKG
jgi:nucleoid-associated protein YgaU